MGWLNSLFSGNKTAPPAAPPAKPPPKPLVVPTTTDAKPLLPAEESTEPVDLDPKAVRLQLMKRLDVMREVATAENDKAIVGLLYQSVVDDALDLPRFPAVADELLRLDSSSALDGESVAGLIARDPDLAARIVQISSSLAFGGVKQTSLAQAVTRLGFEQVRYIAVGVSLDGVVYKIPGYDKEATAVRDAGLASGIFCSALARVSGRTGDTGIAFLSGLFHDVGQALVLRNLSTLRARTKGGAPSQLLVKRLMADMHVPLGTLYTSYRTLPLPVISAVATHHEPNRASPEHLWLSYFVWASDRMHENAKNLDDKEKMAELAQQWPQKAPPFDRVVDLARGRGRAA